MSYRGHVQGNVVVLEGETPRDGTPVIVTPVENPAALTSHPAFGIWKDRTDLPDDAVAASRLLRERLHGRSPE
jgi:hypothetical protein